MMSNTKLTTRRSSVLTPVQFYECGGCSCGWQQIRKIGRYAHAHQTGSVAILEHMCFQSEVNSHVCSTPTSILRDCKDVTLSSLQSGFSLFESRNFLIWRCNYRAIKTFIDDMRHIHGRARNSWSSFGHSNASKSTRRALKNYCTESN